MVPTNVSKKVYW